MNVCCGGIVGMGESRQARAGLLHALATLPAHPESLPVNALVPIPGTPLGDSPPLDGLEFVRTVAVARIVCPKAVVRLSAGRDGMSRELQALCFLAGANSMFIGGKLLTTPLPGQDEDSSCSPTWACARCRASRNTAWRIRRSAIQPGSLPDGSPSPAA
jgi:biotin synthase